MPRSYEKLRKSDLQVMAKIAVKELDALFARNAVTSRLYSTRLIAIALCQGAAVHYVDKKNGRNGVKDFDIWFFFTEHPDRPFPYRWRKEADSGLSRFGRTEGFEHFIGRKIDLMGRSIKVANPDDPAETLFEYLRKGASKSAQELSKKAAVLLYPDRLLGEVVWANNGL